MIITWIVGLLSVAYIVGLAIIGPPVIRTNLPSAGRRERALAMAGRLALPAPATELERAADTLAAVAVSRRTARRAAGRMTPGRRYQAPEVIASSFVWCDHGNDPNLEYSVVIDGVSHRLLPSDDPRGSRDPGPGVHVTR